MVPHYGCNPIARSITLCSQLAVHNYAFRIPLSIMLGIRYLSGPSSSLLDAYGPFPASQPRRVVITGMGLVTPLGLGVQHVWQRLLQGHTAVRQIMPEDLPEAHRAALPTLPSQVAAIVPRNEVDDMMHTVLKEDVRRNSTFMQFALCAASEALSDAKWLPQSEPERQATGVTFGNGMSATAEVAEAGALVVEGKLKRLSPFFVPRILANMAAGAVSIKWGLRGPNHAASTACASGAHAIGDAFRIIQWGDADVMVSGASESCIDAVALGGFSRLKALSASYSGRDHAHLASRPFDAGRDGFVMGEGAGALVLEELGHALGRGARIYAEVRGYGMSGDGHHITQPHPEGLGAQLSMRAALRGSGVEAEEVAYINAHATSTPQGDEVEQRAILAVFGAEACRSLAVSSTKGATGHLLGAAGAVETVFTALALYHGCAPPTVNLERPDPPALLPGLVLGTPGGRSLRAGRKAAMCNSFGFGGTNACLLLTTPPSQHERRNI